MKISNHPNYDGTAKYGLFTVKWGLRKINFFIHYQAFPLGGFTSVLGRSSFASRK